MSIVPKEAIEVVAQSIGITNLSPDVALALAPDVEYRIREIMQESIKCMRHSRRTALTAEDVDSALKLRNVENAYGFTAGDPLRYKRAVGQKDLFYIDEKDIEFKDVIDAPLPKPPLDTSVCAHWLAIEGIQPAIPENPPIDALAVTTDGKRYEYKEDGIPVDIRLPIKHVISRELQLYFDKIRELTLNKPDSILLKQALISLATDSGLHPLLPSLVHFVADEITRNLSKIRILFALVRIVRALLQNPHLHVEPYLHQLMPCIITCLVTKKMGNRFSDNHWDLRNFSASVLASVFKRFGHVYHNLQPRVTRTLLHTFLDPKKTLAQHYGAIQGLTLLGPSVVHMLLMPNLEPYLQLLKPEMLLENKKNEMKRTEAWRVYGALLNAAGLCMYNRLKIFPSLFCPPTRTVWKINRKVILVLPNKRKANSDNLPQQPRQKKLATEGMVGVMPMNSMQMEMQGLASGFSTDGGRSAVSAVTRQLPNENMPGREGSGGVPRASSTVLAQAWKDVNSGHLLMSLFEHFDESMFAFLPKPELSMFL